MSFYYRNYPSCATYEANRWIVQAALGGDWYEKRVVVTARRKEHERRQRIKANGIVGWVVKTKRKNEKGEKKEEREGSRGESSARNGITQVQEEQRKQKKAVELKTGKRGAAKATESSSNCTFPWPVSKSTLQAFSILAPYFSVLLIYRFIVQQPL